MILGERHSFSHSLLIILESPARALHVISNHGKQGKQPAILIRKMSLHVLGEGGRWVSYVPIAAVYTDHCAIHSVLSIRFPAPACT